MKKIVQIATPLIAAFLLLGTIIYLARASTWAEAASSRIPPNGAIIVTTLEDELNTDGDCSLREAVTSANTNLAVDNCGSGDVLTDTISFAAQGTITFTSQITVTGGGPLIIDGGGTITCTGESVVRIFSVDPGAYLGIENLTISRGFAKLGGGIYNQGVLKVNNSSFLQNTVSNPGIATGGGAIFNSGTLLLTNDFFEGNGSISNGGWTNGGALYSEGRATIISSNFLDNQIWPGYGGAIYNSGVITMTNSSISGSSANAAGGILNDFNGEMLIEHSTVTGNSVTGYGGGIANNNELTIADSTIYYNYARASGGGIDSIGTLTVTNTTVYWNVARGYGGIANGGTATISGSTLDSNQAYISGAIGTGGTLLLINSTISGNSSDAVLWNDSGTALITNSTIAGNESENRAAIVNSGVLTATNTIFLNGLSLAECEGTIVDGGHNISLDDSCGFDPASGSMPNTDALLWPLRDNGGPTQTRALWRGSPAIDAGDNAHCPPTDQRGVNRPLDGNGDGLAVCDIGSYELVIYNKFLPSVLASH